MKLKTSQKLTLRKLKAKVYKQHQVKNSQELKKASTLAAKLDLRYKQSWKILISHNSASSNNVIPLASHIAKKDCAASMVKTGLDSLSQDLAAFGDKIESDFIGKRKASKKYRESLTYL